MCTLRLPWGLSGKESACQARDTSLIPGLERSPGRRKWQPTPVFLPWKSHGQRSLAGYSPWGCKRVGHDLTNSTTTTTRIYISVCIYLGMTVPEIKKRLLAP